MGGGGRDPKTGRKEGKRKGGREGRREEKERMQTEAKQKSGTVGSLCLCLHGWVPLPVFASCVNVILGYVPSVWHLLLDIIWESHRGRCVSVLLSFSVL